MVNVSLRAQTRKRPYQSNANAIPARPFGYMLFFAYLCRHFFHIELSGYSSYHSAHCRMFLAAYHRLLPLFLKDKCHVTPS
jgi:hypothetical protein